jgi:hypothetical protein
MMYELLCDYFVPGDLLMILISCLKYVGTLMAIMFPYYD